MLVSAHTSTTLGLLDGGHIRLTNRGLKHRTAGHGMYTHLHLVKVRVASPNPIFRSVGCVRTICPRVPKGNSDFVRAWTSIHDRPCASTRSGPCHRTLRCRSWSLSMGRRRHPRTPWASDSGLRRPVEGLTMETVAGRIERLIGQFRQLVGVHLTDVQGYPPSPKRIR